MRKEKITKREYRKSSNISGCKDCDWTGEGAKEAREHCKKTGHKTWNEYNIVCYYEMEEK